MGHRGRDKRTRRSLSQGASPTHRTPKRSQKTSGQRSKSKRDSHQDQPRRLKPDQWSLKVRELAALLGYPEDRRDVKHNHLGEALTHRTFAHEFSQSKRGREAAKPMRDNQRLEFLGDAVLGMIIASELMTHQPQASEGVLSASRARLINADVLADIAIELGLETYLRIGRGESNMGEIARRARLADLTEAVIGALYLDLGLLSAHAWVWDTLSPKYQKLMRDNSATFDPKTALQHWAHQTHQKTPTYQHQVTNDPSSGEQVYTAQVLLDNEVIGYGKGSNKKFAHFAAAQNALNKS